ncbi:2-dehydro-3-deoxyphosphooctonate aldolase [Hondaea fermentalgiana]|uniref:3-deoxy-8-phosphooctulonate synthase n=1 Tax=Hondaea fermentalgiana TaxID=2315210 RepID=A0A2R5GGP1_9STRA|nr:2-dehydro-3-deoxyphosphooctonate aldolase [Hondaea fermentalgiana]|eukprot:GBG30047.1 2-dehydro-3-deoxyphosphooctonate aldolase [Hondaea fermentalgiana]
MPATPLPWTCVARGVGTGRFALVAGLNVLEDDVKLVRETASAVAEAAREAGLGQVVFKASWDKANRTSASSFRGPGLQRGLELLAEAKDASGLPVVTDVHETSHVDAVAEVADVLQIPSFLCRQTDLLSAAARTGRGVHIKRGQMVGPGVMGHAVEKCRLAGNDQVAVCERGIMLGLDQLAFDPRQVIYLQRACGPEVPILVDATHACQAPPSGSAGKSGGDRSLVAITARAAIAAGADGVFLEVHPGNAPCDPAVQLHPRELLPLLQTLNAIAAAVDSSSSPAAP